MVNGNHTQHKLVAMQAFPRDENIASVIIQIYGADKPLDIVQFSRISERNLHVILCK